MQKIAEMRFLVILLSLDPLIGLILDILIDINDTQVPMVIMML